MDEVNKLMGELIRKKSEDMMFNGSLGTMSTVSNEPTKPLTMEALKGAIDMLKKGDPLQQKGIGRDWYCVINPALVSHIMEFEKQNPAPPYVFNKLDYVMGRRTFIVNEAPLDIEYMTEEMFRRKYPDVANEYFEQLEEIRQQYTPPTE
jgi:hypothetical protein